MAAELVTANNWALPITIPTNTTHEKLKNPHQIIKLKYAIIYAAG